MSFEPMVAGEMVLRHLSVARADAVYVRGILEASDGVAAVFAERGGEMVFAAFPSRVAEMDQLIEDICGELGSSIWLAEPAPHEHSLSSLRCAQVVPKSKETDCG